VRWDRYITSGASASCSITTCRSGVAVRVGGGDESDLRLAASALGRAGVKVGHRPPGRGTLTALGDCDGDNRIRSGRMPAPRCSFIAHRPVSLSFPSRKVIHPQRKPQRRLKSRPINAGSVTQYYSGSPTQLLNTTIRSCALPIA
jgi:hypothetical protein